MTTLLEQIEELRVHVNDLLSAERGLVKALGDELQLADQELLKAIRNVAAEHGARRSVILVELQSLAASVGLLPGPAVPGPRSIPYPGSSGFVVRHEDGGTMRHEERSPVASLDEELQYHLNGRMH